MNIITDGTGTGDTAKVTSDNRLSTIAITEPQIDHAAELGDRYNINTGDITLTTDSESSVLYIKSNEDNDIQITSFIYNLGASTGGTGDWLVEVYRNPTTGAVVSDASDVEMNSNQNFGSSKSLLADVYKGGEGKTLTNGSKSISSRITSSGRVVISLGSLVLTKGTSLGVKITPPTSNTSATVQVAASLYVKNFGD